MNGALQAKLFGVTQLRIKKYKKIQRRNILSPLEERKNTPLIDNKKNRFGNKSRQTTVSQVSYNKTPDTTTVYASKEYLKTNKVSLQIVIYRRNLRIKANLNKRI